jgi:hypothetical protein
MPFSNSQLRLPNTNRHYIIQQLELVFGDCSTTTKSTTGLPFRTRDLDALLRLSVMSLRNRLAAVGRQRRVGAGLPAFAIIPTTTAVAGTGMHTPRTGTVSDWRGRHCECAHEEPALKSRPPNGTDALKCKSAATTRRHHHPPSDGAYLYRSGTHHGYGYPNNGRYLATAGQRFDGAFGIIARTFVADDVGGTSDFECLRVAQACANWANIVDQVTELSQVFAGVGWCGWNGLFVGCRDLVGGRKILVGLARNLGSFFVRSL